MKKHEAKLVRRALLAVLLAGVLALRWIPGAGEWYARSIYPSLSAGLSWLASAVPFSLDEVLVVACAAFLLAYPFCARRRGARWKTIAGHEAEMMLCMYVWFYWGWGANYFRDDFFVRSHTRPVAYEEERFRRFLAQYADSLNAVYAPVQACSPEAVQGEVKRIYALVPGSCGLCSPRSYQRPKQSMCNWLYSGVGVLGYMGPFFAESHVNHELLPVQYPFTYAHELSHLLGVSSEAEANFWAYQVCLRSAEPSVRYSGYFGLLPYVLGNARQLLSESDYRDWVKTIRPEVMRELYAEQDYWDRRYSRAIGAVQDVLYTWYLKGNRISSGQKNYAEVVGMLLALPDDWWK